jgi:inhibitor of cysteine peptidase
MNARSAVYRSLVVMLPAILIVLAGCGPVGDRELGNGPEEANIGAEDNGAQVKLAPGQTLVLTLEGNPSTGYSWDVVEVEDSVLRPQGEPEFKAVSDQEPAPPGAGGVQVLRFRAVGSGETPLKLNYHRSWEKDVKPADTYSIQVVVR